MNTTNTKIVLTLLQAILLLALFFACVKMVNAKPWAEMPNNGGGKIVLTDEKCVVNGRRFDNIERAYGFHSNGSKIEGCYGFVESTKTIEIIWVVLDAYGRPSTSERIYNLADFTVIDVPGTEMPKPSKNPAVLNNPRAL